MSFSHSKIVHQVVESNSDDKRGQKANKEPLLCMCSKVMAKAHKSEKIENISILCR